MNSWMSWVGWLVTAVCCNTAAAAVHVSIPALQGTGDRSPFTGQQVVTDGVVTLTTDHGFFLQDPAGDGDPLTSDGLFVHTGDPPRVTAGQAVQLAGMLMEYTGDTASSGRRGAARPRPDAPGLTQLTGATVLRVRRATVPVRPVRLQWPLPDGVTLERFEGMRVTLDGPFTVASSRGLAALGQLLLFAGPRPRAATDVVAPGAPARAAAEAQARRRIVFDDGRARRDPVHLPFGGPGPSVRAGATLAQLDGVIDQGAVSTHRGPFGYRVQPVATPTLVPGPPRPALPPPVGGSLRVAAFNVQNYFTTLRTGPQSCAPHGACRGAAHGEALARQRAQLVEVLHTLDADIVGLVEIENRGDVALHDLVAALNARAGAERYAAVPSPEGGSGSDAIRVALLHRPATAVAVGPAASDTALVHERAPLAQLFHLPAGGRLWVAVSHFKSKRCDGAAGADLDQHDGQGCFNARRLRQAQALKAFAVGQGARTGTGNLLLIGDFNSHTREDPLQVLAGADGWTDLLARHDPGAYTHVFDGVAGRLDGAVASPALASAVTGAGVWHINADESPPAFGQEAGAMPAAFRPEPFRSSDHDPVLIGIDLRTKSRPPPMQGGVPSWKDPVRPDTPGHAARRPP